jgi:hypothetical protein
MSRARCDAGDNAPLRHCRRCCGCRLLAQRSVRVKMGEQLGRRQSKTPRPPIPQYNWSLQHQQPETYSYGTSAAAPRRWRMAAAPCVLHGLPQSSTGRTLAALAGGGCAAAAAATAFAAAAAVAGAANGTMYRAETILRVCAVSVQRPQRRVLRRYQTRATTWTRLHPTRTYSRLLRVPAVAACKNAAPPILQGGKGACALHKT